MASFQTNRVNAATMSHPLAIAILFLAAVVGMSDTEDPLGNRLLGLIKYHVASG